MADYYIPAGGNRAFAAGAFPNNATMDDLHNVVGNSTYQIGAAPVVTLNWHLNDPSVTVPVNGVPFTVVNNLPAELKVSS